MRSTSLDTANAIELRKPLQFIGGRPDTDTGQLGAALARSAGHSACHIGVRMNGSVMG